MPPCGLSGEGFGGGTIALLLLCLCGEAVTLSPHGGTFYGLGDLRLQFGEGMVEPVLELPPFPCVAGQDHTQGRSVTENQTEKPGRYHSASRPPLITVRFALPADLTERDLVSEHATDQDHTTRATTGTRLGRLHREPSALRFGEEHVSDPPHPPEEHLRTEPVVKATLLPVVVPPTTHRSRQLTLSGPLDDRMRVTGERGGYTNRIELHLKQLSAIWSDHSSPGHAPIRS